jgi:hypothetical protein
MQTNRRTLISCLSVVFAVAIFVISTITTTAAETIPVSLMRPPTVSRFLTPTAACRDHDGRMRQCIASTNDCLKSNRNKRVQCSEKYVECMKTC